MRLVAVAPNPSIDRLYELDRFRLGDVNRPRVETRVAGGKGLNVARAALALGTEVVAVALVAGHAGRWLAETLAAEGIPGRFAWTAGETRTCVAIHDAEADTLTELNEAGPPVSAEAWAAFVGAVGEELAAGDVGLLTVSGTLAPDAPTGGLAELAAMATALGVPVALDAGGPALDQALETRPWLVKLNASEAAATLGTGATPSGQGEALAAALRIAARTGGAVIVTLGIDGAVAVGPDGMTYRVSAPSVRGPFPVGSGDAFLAGVSVATLRGDAFLDALRLGAATAAANALTRGAGRLEPAEVQRLIPTMRIDSPGS